MSLRLQPVHVGTGSGDSESQLVFCDGFLVAVLAQLSDGHGSEVGRWFLEAGFGPVDHPDPPTFVGLNAAQGWIEQQLADAA